MRDERIEKIEDPRVAIFRDVRDSAMRERHGLFMVESRLCVERLLESGRWQLRALFVSDSALAVLRPTLERWAPEAAVYVAEPEVLHQVVGYPLHRGCIAAAARGPELACANLVGARSRLLVGLDEVANPENVGNVFRNAAAFGADAVLLSPGCADPLYRKSIRVSMAATLRVPFARVVTWPGTAEMLRTAGMTTLALSTDSEAPSLQRWLREHPSATRLALLLGSEGDGLRPDTAGACDARVRIPMGPGVDSLNVATASGIALHHCFERVTPAES